MFIYIFPYVRHLTDRYHSSGGLVVAAKGGIERVKELIAEDNMRSAGDYMGSYGDAYLDYDDPPKFIAPSPEEFENALVYKLAGSSPEGVFVFPDAGCC